MIIPIKCFTCGKVLADKYLYYTQRVNEIKTSRGLDKNEVKKRLIEWQKKCKYGYSDINGTNSKPKINLKPVAEED